MKRVYIAGRYHRRDEFRLYAEELRKRGMEVTSRWLDETLPLDVNHTSLSDAENTDIALKDAEDIQRSSHMLFFAEDPYNQPPRGGRHVEFGLAYAWGLSIGVIGGNENVFHFLDDVHHFESFEKVLEQIDAN